MIKALLCKVFGHKLIFNYEKGWYCDRCGKLIKNDIKL